MLRATERGAATSTADGPGPCPTCPTVFVMAEMAKVVNGAREIEFPSASITGCNSSKNWRGSTPSPCDRKYPRYFAGIIQTLRVRTVSVSESPTLNGPKEVSVASAAMRILALIKVGTWT